MRMRTRLRRDPLHRRHGTASTTMVGNASRETRERESGGERSGSEGDTGGSQTMPRTMPRRVVDAVERLECENRGGREMCRKYT